MVSNEYMNIITHYRLQRVSEEFFINYKQRLCIVKIFSICPCDHCASPSPTLRQIPELNLAIKPFLWYEVKNVRAIELQCWEFFRESQ